jgi:hypothetical protein
MPELALALLRLATAGGLLAAARRLGVLLVYAATATVAGLGALGCILAAAWLALLPAVGRVGAPLIIALVLAAVAAIAILLLRRGRSPAAGGSRDRPSDLLSTLLSDKETVLLLGIALAGFLAGRNIGRPRR